MSDAEIEDLARRMGARIVCKLPSCDGVLGAAFLAHFYQRRMAELRVQDATADAPVIVQAEPEGNEHGT